MKSKTMIRILLLVFVVASGAALVGKELRRHEEEHHPASAEPAAAAGPSGAAPLSAPAHQVMVYYFHGRYRCPTCLKIEAYTREAVQNGFAEELKSGTLVWQAVNVEEPAHRHFIKDYQLYTKSVIVSDQRHGRETRWKNLPEIWTLISVKADFQKYIQDEVRVFLQEGQ